MTYTLKSPMEFSGRNSSSLKFGVKHRIQRRVISVWPPSSNASRVSVAVHLACA